MTELEQQPSENVKKIDIARIAAHAVNEYFAINYLFNVIGCWKTDHKFGCYVELAFK